MRLPEGIVLDVKHTFGTLRFSTQRRERLRVDAEGYQTNEVTERTFDLKSQVQGQMIQVSIPANAGEKSFAYNQIVKLVNPVIDAVPNSDFRRAWATWYLKADDLVTDATDIPSTTPKMEAKNHAKK